MSVSDSSLQKSRSRRKFDSEEREHRARRRLDSEEREHRVSEDYDGQRRDRGQHRCREDAYRYADQRGGYYGRDEERVGGRQRNQGQHDIGRRYRDERVGGNRRRRDEKGQRFRGGRDGDSPYCCSQRRRTCSRSPVQNLPRFEILVQEQDSEDSETHTLLVPPSSTVADLRRRIFHNTPACGVTLDTSLLLHAENGTRLFAAMTLSEAGLKSGSRVLWKVSSRKKGSLRELLQPADVELFGQDRAARTYELEMQFSGHAPVDPYRLEMELVEVQLPDSLPGNQIEGGMKAVAFVKSTSGL
jgi:hypothetical protein